MATDQKSSTSEADSKPIAAIDNEFPAYRAISSSAILSLVLVFVINRQSFNWSIDLAIPVWQLAVLSVTLIAAAAITAVWSGRAATSQDAVRAVREDW